MVPPYIVILPAIGDVPFDTKNTLGRTWTQDIACYTAADGSGLVDQIAQRIRGLGDGAYGFHRHRLAISGFSTIVSECGSVIQAPTDKTMYGRMVTLTLTAMQA
jgi:hypothetical protein